MNRIKAKVAARIKESHKIAISSHVRPDADSIGSGLALSLMLRQLGKRVLFCNTDPAPHPINLLPHYSDVKLRQIYPEPFDTVILIEGGNEERTGQKHLDRYFTVNIDHHETSSKEPNLNWVVPEASAVGELVYELGKTLKTKITGDIAFNLYAAISTDTGSFKYTNTTARSLRIAADVVQRGGIAPFQVVDLVFNSNPYEKIQMMGHVLSTLRLTQNRQVAMIEFKKDFLAKLSLKEIETEDIITIARSIDGVRVLLFFKEIDKDFFRVSIRSRDNFSSQKVASVFKGGGHHHAAGFFFRGDLKTAKREILKVIQKQL